MLSEFAKVPHPKYNHHMVISTDFLHVLLPRASFRLMLSSTIGTHGKMIISLSLNITMNRLGGASVIAIFTTRPSHGYVNTTTWLGISQFFLFLVPNFNILTTENRSRCNRDLN